MTDQLTLVHALMGIVVVKTAEEFLLAAHAAAANSRYRAFIDNLSSAVELMAKALLLSASGRDALA
jgi:uncharacterized protein (UPF0332 family)